MSRGQQPCLKQRPCSVLLALQLPKEHCSKGLSARLQPPVSGWVKASTAPNRSNSLLNSSPDRTGPPPDSLRSKMTNSLSLEVALCLRLRCLHGLVEGKVNRKPRFSDPQSKAFQWIFPSTNSGNVLKLWQVPILR